tara:strand:- start:100 stop:1107 length:1008 start_codon:yes stop_codon:yes gene_type:complete
LKKILIIRFSSFGDVVQAMNATLFLKKMYPDVEITWLTKKVFKEFLLQDQQISNVATLEEDFNSKITLIKSFIVREKFDLVFDAHRNLRTFLLRLSFVLSLKKINWIYRPKNRLKRILLFKFGLNLFPNPFYARDSYLAPLNQLDLCLESQGQQQSSYMNFEKINKENFKFLDKDFLIFAPSAAWEMKRWPKKHWSSLIEKASENYLIILVGGANDLFIDELYHHNNKNVINMSGKTTFYETFFLVSKSIYTLSADTGVIHVAEYLNKPGGLLLGPTAFGRTKSDLIKVFEVDLPCRPCSKDGRGTCSRKIYQECLSLLTPEDVLHHILQTAKQI